MCSYISVITFAPMIIIFVLISSNFMLINCYGLSQHFEKHPESQYTGLKGMSLQIPCIVRNRQGECLWLHNRSVLLPIGNKYTYQRTPNNGDCTITIEDLDLKRDNGEWQCQVTAPNINQNTLQSESANVIVLVAPSKPFIKHVTGNKLQVLADRNSEIECQVNNGNPPPQILWFIDGVNVTHDSRSNTLQSDTIQTVTSHLIHTFKRTHRNSSIVCQALHQIINQNDSVAIDVQYRPQVSVPQGTYTVNEDSDLNVECQVDANPKASAVWKQITGIHYPNVRMHSNLLSITRITRDMNKAIFECSAQNEHGNAENPVTVTLNVLYQPRLLKSSEPEKSVQYGESTRIFCEYDGNPKPEIYWYHINPISDAVRHRPNDEQNGSALVIENATYHDEGHYYCEALNHNSIINKDFIVRSAKFVVDIIGKPEIIDNPMVIQGIRGSPADVYLTFCSDPPPNTIYWQIGSLRFDVNNKNPYQNGQLNGNNSSLYARFNVHSLLPLDKTSFSSNPTCFRAKLSISDSDISDEREYSLFVANARGVTEGVVKLKIGSPMSAAMMITIGLIVLVLLFMLTIVTMILIRKRRLLREKDDESKADVQTPMKPDDDKLEKDADKDKEHHELVYANLEFTKSSDGKPKTKPQIQQRQHRTNGGNATEYAQITFTNKADL